MSLFVTVPRQRTTGPVFRIDAARIDRYEMVGERMRVDVFMSRTGVQEYDQGDGTVQREQRDAAEVFAAEALASMRGMPITVQHPDIGMLDGRNWRDLTHGFVGDEVRKADDGMHTFGRAWILDADVQARVRSGELCELSVGYYAGLDYTAGTNDRGEKYDVRQTNIRGNHLALLEDGQARGGPGCRVRLDARGNCTTTNTDIAGDKSAKNDSPAMPPANQEEELMQLTIRADGYDHQIEAADEKVLRALEKDAEGTRAKLDAEQARADKAEQERDELQAKLDAAADTIGRLEQERDAALDPKAISDAAAKRSKLMADAKAVAGADVEGDSDQAIKRAALEKATGTKMDSQSDAYIDARFDIELGLAAERAKQNDSVSRARQAAVPTGDEAAGRADARTPLNLSAIQRETLSGRKEAN